jgi:hypothetical protein
LTTVPSPSKKEGNMRILNASDEQKGDAADSPHCSPGEFFFCLSKCVKPVISIEQAKCTHSLL